MSYLEDSDSLEAPEDYDDIVSEIHAEPESKRMAYDTFESVPENTDFDNMTESNEGSNERLATPEESLQSVTPSQFELLWDFWDATEHDELHTARKILSRATSLEERKKMKIEDSNGKFVLGDWSFLCLAIFRKSIEIVKLLMRDYRDRVSAYTSLVRVIQSDSELIFNFYGPTDTTSLTALDVACALGSEPIVDLFLQHLEGIESFTNPLCLSLANGHEAIFRKVLQRRSDDLVPSVTYDLRKCFQFACCGGMRMVNLFNEIFGEHEPDPDSILWAAYGARDDVIRFLIKDFQLKLSIVDVYRKNALHYLCLSHRTTVTNRISTLKYLMNTGEFFVDKEDSLSNTPLAFACLERNFELAEVLIEMKANLQLKATLVVREAVLRNDHDVAPGMSKLGLTISKCVLTPFSALDKDVQHRPCFDSFVVERVIVPEATCSLHWACWQGTEESLRLLLQLRGGANIEERDTEGKTPVFACTNLANLRLLVEYGANIEAIDKEGWTLLHVCAKNFHLNDCTKMLKYLIEKGLSVEQPVKGYDSFEFRLPHEVSDFEPRVFLHSEYVKKVHSRLDKEKVEPAWVQFSFVGRPRAGKTTLANSLRLVSKLIEPDDRTAGVEVHNTNVFGVGLTSLWDFGGHVSFRVAHAIFFNYSLSVFILVIDLCHDDGARKTRKDIYEEALESLAFVKSSRRIIAMKSGKVTVVTVGNKKTGDGKDDNLTPCQDFIYAIDDAIKEFDGVFDKAAVVELDCNKPSSQSMTDFRSQMKQIRDSCIKNADEVPKVCERLKFLIFTVINGKPDSYRLLKEEELGKLLADSLDRPLPDEVSVPKIASYLHDTGAIVYFPDLNRVCLRPSVLVTNLIGPLLSSPNVFPISAVDSGSGRATKFQMKTALDRFKKKQSSERNPTTTFTTEDGISIMLDLGLCCKVQDAEDVYYIPSLIEDTKPLGVWEKTPKLTFYRGRRYRVSNETTDIVPPPMFCVLQSRCSVLPDYRIMLWKDGLKLESHGGLGTAECLVQLSSNRRKSIDVLVRCREGEEAAAKRTWEKVEEVVEAVHKDRAPGTPMEWCYLSSQDSQEHKEHVAVYERNDIDNRDPDERIRARHSRDGGFPVCRVRDLLFPIRREDGGKFPGDEEKVSKTLINAVASAGCLKWEKICCSLLDTCALKDIKREYTDSSVCLQMVLERWLSENEEGATVGQLMKACKRSQISRNCIEKDFEDLLSYDQMA